MSKFTSFTYQHDQLFAESVSLIEIAKEFGTPCYVYSRAALMATYQEFHRAFAGAGSSHLLCSQSQLQSRHPQYSCPSREWV